MGGEGKEWERGDERRGEGRGGRLREGRGGREGGEGGRGG